MENKICPKCKILKPVTYFGNSKYSRDGKACWCKPCHQQARKSWELRNKEKRLHHKSSYMSRLRIKDKVRADKYQSDFYAKNPNAKLIHGKTYRLTNRDSILKRARLQRINDINGAGYLSRKRTARRRAIKILACPTWANAEKIDAMYIVATSLSKILNEMLDVDHIIPLNSKTVCGLHCEDNLQIIPKSVNQSKGNKYHDEWEWTEKTKVTI